MDLKRLSDKFPPSKIEWRVGNMNKDKTKALALAYVTNRAIQDRLDEVCGPGNWKNEYSQWKEKHQLCGISILINGEWVTKWDGAEDTDFEPIKGGLSASMKRAAAQWGIGRYLYDVPAKWYKVVPKGKSYVFDSTEELPKLPKEFLPEGCKNTGYQIDSITPEEKEILNLKNNKPQQKITKEESISLSEIIMLNDINVKKLLKWGNVEKIEDLTQEQYKKLLEIYTKQDFVLPEKVKNLGVTEEETKRLAEINKKVGEKK